MQENSVTPDTGAEEAVTPPAAATTEAEAVDRISDFLEGKKAPEPPAEVTREEPQTEAEEAPEASEPKESEAQEAEAEPEGEVELPDTWQGWAEEVGIDADELAQHVTVPIKVNGETSTVPLAEAIKGYQREADYVQKTQALAQERQQLEVQHAQASQAQAQQIDALGHLLGQLQSQVESVSEDDLDVLLEEGDFEGYHKAKRALDAQKEALRQGQEALAGQYQQMQQQTQQQMAVYRNEQLERLKGALPELADTTKAQTFVKNLEAFMQKAGYSSEEIQQFGNSYDHRTVVMMRKAMLYDAFQEGKKETGKKLKPLPKVNKPGGPLKRKAPDDNLNDARARLRKGRGRMTRQQEDKAAVDLVKQIMG